MSIGRSLYFIFMPLVYELLFICFTRDFCYSKQDYKKHAIIDLICYYSIEAIFILTHFVVTKEWIFMKNTQFDFGSYELFVWLSIGFIAIHMLILGLDLFDKEKWDFSHLAVLGIFFLIFLVIFESGNVMNMDDYYFRQTPFEKVSEKTIYLEAFSDTTAVNGEIHGGRSYINGSIQEDYELYYSFLNEKGSLVIRHFTYHEDTCEIYPEEDCENPTITIETYQRSYKDKSEINNRYILHIPKNSISNSSIDFQ